MKESELRAAVEKRRSISEETWAYLEDKGLLGEAVDECGEAEKDPVGYLVAEINRLFAAVPDGSGRTMPPGAAPYSRAFDYINEYEREHMEVRAEVLAKHAGADEAVQAFRERFLGGRLLTPEQAQGFVTSLANQHLPVQWFDEHEVSFWEHTTEIRTISFVNQKEVIEFTIQPAGIDCRVINDDLLEEEYGKGRMLFVAGDPPDVIQQRRNDVSLPTSEEVDIAQDGLPDLGYWRGFTGHVRTNSPLGALRDLGGRLTKRYRSWKSHYATRFVLTGETPEETSPLWAETGPTGEAVLHIAPWISPESVKNAYTGELWFRGWMSERYNWSKGSKAKRQRRLDDKTLKLLRFVTARMDQINDSREKRNKGSRIAAEWDEMCPEWAYRGDTRTMWRDYSRALQSVAPIAARNDSFDSNRTVTGATTGEQL